MLGEIDQTSLVVVAEPTKAFCECHIILPHFYKMEAVNMKSSITRDAQFVKKSLRCERPVLLERYLRSRNVSAH